MKISYTNGGVSPQYSDVMEFVAAITQHIPEKSFQMVR